MARGCDMLKIYDLDLQLKITEPFEGQTLEILSSLLSNIDRNVLSHKHAVRHVYRQKTFLYVIVAI